MVNDHRYKPVRTSEWPPERYSDSEGGRDEDSSEVLTDVDAEVAFGSRTSARGPPNRLRGGGQGMVSHVGRTGIENGVSADARPVRRWKLLPGRNRFFCDGRIIMARQMGVFYFTVSLIVVTSGLFFAFDCPYLATKVSPVLPVVGSIMFLFVMSTLLRTSFMDPGIIPRADNEEAREIEKQIEVQNGVNSPTYRPPPRTKEIVVNKVTVKLKYCFTCKIFRPPRASHCSICDNCVERFDHHCPWVGNCVGKRNYRFFYLFIVSLGFYCMFIFACVNTHLALLVYEKNTRFLDAIQETPASLLVAIVCFLSVWSILGLAGFHTYLIFSNQTTNEDIKGSFSSRRGVEVRNPYSRPGLCGNCSDILCGPFHPSLLRRRELVSPDDVRRNEAALRSLDHEVNASAGVNVAVPTDYYAAGAASPTGSDGRGRARGAGVNRASYGTTDGLVADPAIRSPMNGSAAQSPTSLPSPSSAANENGDQRPLRTQFHSQRELPQPNSNRTPKKSKTTASGGASRSPKRDQKHGQWIGSTSHPLLLSADGRFEASVDAQADAYAQNVTGTESVLDSLDLDSLDGSGSGAATTLSSSSHAGLIIKNSHII